MSDVAVRGLLLLLVIFSLASLRLGSSFREDGADCGSDCVQDSKQARGDGRSAGLVLLQTSHMPELQKVADPFDDVLDVKLEALSSGNPGLQTVLIMGKSAAKLAAQCLVPDLLALLAAGLGFQLFRSALRRGEGAEMKSLDKKRYELQQVLEPMSPISPITATKVVEETDAFGCTKLHRACHEGKRTEVRRLIELGSFVDAREAWDETPLHFAARAGHKEVCQLLINHRAMLDPVNADEKTPLVVAAEGSKEDVCDFLLDRGAGVAGAREEDLPPMLTALLCRRMLEDRPVVDFH